MPGDHGNKPVRELEEQETHHGTFDGRFTKPSSARGRPPLPEVRRCAVCGVFACYGLHKICYCAAHVPDHFWDNLRRARGEKIPASEKPLQGPAWPRQWRLL